MNIKRLAICCVMAGSLAAQARPVYVATNSPANGPGTGWSNAFHTIQAAVNATTDGDTVWVTNGMYRAGGAASLGVANYLTNRVCISNLISVQSVNGPAVTTIVGAADPQATNGPAAVRCVFMNNGALIGFTLTGGHTDQSSGLDGRGGGLALIAGLVVNCVVTGNTCDVDGGGVTCEAQDTSVLSNCTISANVAGGSGGGIACDYGELHGCTIAGNGAGVSGGGAWLGNAVADDCSFTGNTALQYGGGIVIGGGACTIRHSVIADNATGGDGGGIYGGATVSQCIVQGNTASGDGGGVWSSGSALLFNTLIAGNVATNESGAGGGGVYLQGSAGEYGALANCTLSGNSAGLAGGGLYCSVAGLVTNCIIYFNSAGAGAANWTNVDVDPSVCSYGYTCTLPTNGLPGGRGCLTNDPRFLDRSAGNYYLRYGSRCIDAGLNLASRGITNDLDGVKRPLDGNFDGTNVFDIGCYEYSPQTTDSDGDGARDADEITAGTDPSDPASYFHVVALSNLTSSCRVYFPSVTNRLYALQYRTNLVSGVWTNVVGQTNLSGNGTVLWMTDTNMAAPRFFRLKAQGP